MCKALWSAPLGDQSKPEVPMGRISVWFGFERAICFQGAWHSVSVGVWGLAWGLKALWHTEGSFNVVSGGSSSSCGGLDPSMGGFR